jgi:hypothetical protein
MCKQVTKVHVLTCVRVVASAITNGTFTNLARVFARRVFPVNQNPKFFVIIPSHHPKHAAPSIELNFSNIVDEIVSSTWLAVN